MFSRRSGGPTTRQRVRAALALERLEDRLVPSTSPSAANCDGVVQPKVVEIKDFSFGVENPTIGSATGGAGAGKIKFNEFTIKRTTDSASPAFFVNSPAGASYATQNGLSPEYMVALANELDANAWFQMPHLADDDYQRTFIQDVHDTVQPTHLALELNGVGGIQRK